LEFRYVDLFQQPPRALDLQQAAGLVVMGGPMNVDEVQRYPFLAAEVEWIDQALEQQLPMLGICLGSQLLAKAAGARVYPNGIKEIGWYALETLPATADDRLFAGCQATETVFQWHGDTFDLPVGAVHLARSTQCEHQAIRVGPCAWGLQFHIEMTPGLVDCWLSESGNCGELSQLDYINPVAIRAATAEKFPQMERFGQRILPRFAALCAQRASV
jgi:GMP synthase-like glutamine amidotransferase